MYAVVITSMLREHSAIRALIYRVSTTGHDTPQTIKAMCKSSLYYFYKLCS